jgi:hypothetical protein
MDAQAHSQVYPPLLRQAGIELAQGLHHAQSSAHGPLGVIFVRPGVAKVDEQAIAQILRDMPVKAGDHLGAGILIGPHHLVQLFRVKLASESGRVHQVTKQHRQLAAFSLGLVRFGQWRSSLREETYRGFLPVRRCGGHRRRGWARASGPDQHATVFIHGQALTVNEFLLQVCQEVIIQMELPFEGAIGHASAALEQGNSLIQQLLKSHT